MQVCVKLHPAILAHRRKPRKALERLDESGRSELSKSDAKRAMSALEDAKVGGVTNGEALIAWRGRRILLSSPDRNHAWEILWGSEDPKLGWRSHRFNQKQPIPTLRIRAQIDGTSTIRTYLRVNS